MPQVIPVSEMRDATHDAFQSPRVGDLFSEMAHYWVLVAEIRGPWLCAWEGVKGRMEFRWYMRPEFATRFRYSAHLGYSVSLYSRDNPVPPVPEDSHPPVREIPGEYTLVDWLVGRYEA